MMEHGGNGLFDFVKSAHRLISEGRISHQEWQKAVKVIFKQMVESVEYIHNKNVCHFDLSLENFLVNVKVRFVTDEIQVKLCDFGMLSYMHLYMYNISTLSD